MKRFVRALVVALLGLPLVALGIHSADAAAATVTNGTQFTDTAGNVVQAHGGGVIKVGSLLLLVRREPQRQRHVPATSRPTAPPT